MTPEEWDGEIAEQLLRDAEAVAGELMQTLDEVADGFDSESFEASVTGDDHRLLRLAEDARTSAFAGRDIAQAYEVFAQAVAEAEAEADRTFWPVGPYKEAGGIFRLGYREGRRMEGRDSRERAAEEKEAVERLKGGDAGGLEALVRRHHDRAVGAAYLVVRDKGLAEDVAQASFLRAFEKIGRFDVGRPFAPWFMKIVLNGAVEAARRRGREASREVGGAERLLVRLADPGPGPNEEAEKAEMSRRVWAALGQLPPAQRAAVVQRYYLGMTEAEMSGGGATPAGTVKSRLSAARKGLSKILRPEFGAIRAQEARAPWRPVGRIEADPLEARRDHD